MSFLFSNWLAENGFVQSLCWTLLHSLWQGLIVTIIAIIIVSTTRRIKPSIRYNLLAALFFLFLIAVVVTFVRELQANRLDRPTSINSSLLVGHDTEPGFSNIPSPHATPNNGYVEAFVRYLNEHASWIVLVWLVIFMAKLIKTLTNISYVQKIRKYKTTEPSDFWKQRIFELGAVLQLKKAVTLLESSIVKTPVLIGYLKPIVLVPIGLLSNLPPKEIEAILIHELAHVRRLDYLMNLLQNMAEVVFFFNPGFVWISSLLREERENCCDDITIGQTNDKREFINALLAFQEYAIKQHGVAFAGDRHHLLNRVRRIIYNENKKLNAMEKGIFVLSIVVISFIGFASMTQPGKTQRKSQLAIQPASKDAEILQATQDVSIPDTVPAPTEFKSFTSHENVDGGVKTRTIHATDKDGQEYELIYKNEKPVEFHFNGKLIPTDQFEKYKNIINALEEAAKARNDENISKLIKSETDRQVRAQELNAERQNLLSQLNEIDRKRAELDDKAGREADARNDASDLLLRIAGQDEAIRQKQLMDRNSDLEKDQHFDLLKDKSSVDLFERNQLKEQALKSDLSLLNQQSLQDSHDAYDKLYDQFSNGSKGLFLLSGGNNGKNQLQALAAPIIDDMAARNIINGTEGDLTFELTKKSFTVNGKKQPSELHEEFVKKYMKSDKDFFIYSRKDGRLSISINVN